MCLMAEGKREDEHMLREHTAKTGRRHIHLHTEGQEPGPQGQEPGPQHRVERCGEGTLVSHNIRATKHIKVQFFYCI